MQLLRYRTILAVLWVIKAMGFSAYLLLYFMHPGSLEGMVAGNFLGIKLSAGMNFVFGFFWWVPWMMAWLSLTLERAAVRWLSLVLGIMSAVGLIFNMIMHPSMVSSALVGDYIMSIFVSLLIVWYAWNLPKEEA